MTQRARFDTKVGDLLFRRGQSALVIVKIDSDKILGHVDWPRDKRNGRQQKLIPRTQAEMDEAIEAWFEFIERKIGIT